MNDETTPEPDLREQIADALVDQFGKPEFGPHTRPPWSMSDPDPRHLPMRVTWREPGGSGYQAASAAEVTEVMWKVVQPELDRLTERIPYREGETEEQYLERQIARWRSEAWQARGKLREASAERKQLEATVARVKALAEELIATGDVSIGGIWSDHNIEIGGNILAVLDQPREETT